MSEFSVFYACEYADHSDLCNPELVGRNKAPSKTKSHVLEVPGFYARGYAHYRDLC